MYTDFVINEGNGLTGHGEIGQRLQGVRWDPGLMRLIKREDRYGRSENYVVINTGRMKFDRKRGEFRPIYVERLVRDCIHNGINSPVFNSTLGLRKLEWELLDTTVLLAARKRLRAWGDLAAASSYSVPGMSKTMLEHETMSDPGFAVVDMDARTDARADTPLYQLQGLPLPITHSDFTFGQRELAVSRSVGQGLDLRMAEACGRRVAEMVEKTTIGVVAGLAYSNPANTPTYGRTPQVQGYTNFSARNTYTSVTTPTGSNPQSTVSNLLAMRDILLGQNFFGPYMVYHSNDWDQYLDNDYAFTNGSNWATNPNMTLRDRLRKTDGVVDVRRLDFWTPINSSNASLPYQLLMIQMTSEVARAVIGLDITTVQWPEKGGLEENFKVMTIMVPQLRADFNGNCGMCHGTTQ